MRPQLAIPTYACRGSQRSMLLTLGLAAVALVVAACASPAADNAAPSLGSGSPAPTASASPSPAPSQPATCAKPPAPDLCNATVDIPSWGEGDAECPHGAVMIDKGRYTGLPHNPLGGIRMVLSADVDHDGVAEEVALASCQIGDPGIDQVFVVDHTSSGALHTMGQIIRPGQGFSFGVHTLAAGPDGSVRVQLSNVLGSDETAEVAQVTQWRTYGWNGQRFIQTAGSTSFDADRSATRLTMSVAPAVFAKPQGTLRRGTFTVTVHNTGTTPASAVAVRLIIDDWLSLSPGPCDPQGHSIAVESCPFDIAAGGTRTITFNATITAADALMLVAHGGGPGLVMIQLRLGDQLYTTVRGSATFP